MCNILLLTATQLRSETLPFRVLNNDDGLQSSNLLCVLEDSYGYLWFGTGNGLHRYNGIDFILYEHNPNDENSISGNVIFKIIEDANKNLFVCTNNGLNFFDRGSSKFTSIPTKIEYADSTVYLNNLYSPMAILTSNNKLYACLGKYGIFCLNNSNMVLEKVNWLANPKYIPLGIVTSVCEESDGTVWMGSQMQGLFKVDFKNESLIQYTDSSKQNYINSNNIYSVFRDTRNRLWVGNENGLNIFNEKTGRFEHFQLDAPKGSDIKVQIYTISGDKNGNVWFGSDGCGVYQLKANNEIVNYINQRNNINSLNSNFIRAIHVDKNDNLWVATREGGVNYVLNNNALIFTNYKEKTEFGSGLNFRNVTAISKGNTPNNFFIGTDGGGIDKLNAVTNEVEHIDAVSSKSVMAILVDGPYLWFGGYLDGLTQFNQKNNTYLNYRYNEFDKNSIGHNDVRYILKDKQQQLWIATNGGGLNLFNEANEMFTRFQSTPNTSNSLVSNYCITLYEDTKLNLWIGTYDGFSILDPSRKHFKNFVNVKNKNSLSSNWVYCFHEDKKGRMWIGTNFGLNLYDANNGKFTIYLKENGLPGNEIMGIIEDEKGQLWLSTNNGLCLFNIEQDQFTIFDNQDGLISNQFVHGAYLKGDNDVFLFGSSNGLTVFNPQKIIQNKVSPPIYLTAFSNTQRIFPFNTHKLVDGYAVYPEIKIPFKEASVIEINFDALNFINSKKNKFRYFLEGYDKEWHNVGNYRTASYSNLNPGTYTFRVIASNNANVWNNLGAKITFIIKPPLHKTLVAKILYYLLVVLVVYLLWRVVLIRENFKRELAFEHLKREKSEELAQMKTDFFTNISHELSTPLTLIIVPLQRIFESETYDKSLLSTALNNSKRLLKLVNELLDFQKVEDGKMVLSTSENDMVLFISEILKNFHDAFAHKGIDLKFSTNLTSLNMMFDAEKMEKILYNLISNALKYTAEKGSVTIAVSITDNNQTNIGDENHWVAITVTDTGQGIPAEKLPFIFDKYFRVQEPDKRKKLVSATGYGIGLYMTRLLTQMHNGFLNVKSTEGQGTTFTVNIPLVKTDNNEVVLADGVEFINLKPTEFEFDAEDESVDNESKNTKPLVLVIEDNKELQQVLVGILSTNYRVMEAYDGQRGLHLATRHLPDLIITDIMMPIMDGIEVCEKIKTDFYTSHIPVIMLTALNTNDSRLKGYKTGADDYISKPFDSKLLEVRVKNLIDSRKNLHRKFVTDLKVTPAEITVTSADEEFLEKAIAAVEKNIENPEFSVAELAGLMNMSEATLYRKVKAITSQSPNIFIRTIRFKRAAQLLKTTKYSITEVVDLVGLNDVKYFRKCFQQQFGQNPLEFSRNTE